MKLLEEIKVFEPIGAWIEQLGYSDLSIRVILALSIVLGFTLTVRLVLATGRCMVSAFEATDRWRVPALRIQDQEILSAAEVGRVLGAITRTTSWFVVGVLGLLALHLLFGLFAWTETWAQAIQEKLIETVVYVGTGLVDYLPDLLIIVVVIIVARFFLHVLHLVFDGIASRRIALPGFYPEWADTSFNLLRILVFALTLIVIFPYLPGAGSPAFQGLSIFFGVLLSLGSTSAVANVVAGIVLTYTRAFKTGDFIRIDHTEGEVAERSMFVTRLETRKNEVVSIPNASVLASHIINYSAQADQRGLIVHTTITLGYDVPWRDVHALLLKAAAEVEGIEQKPAPFVLQKSLDDFTVAYELNATTRQVNALPRVYSDLHQSVQDRCAAAGIEITSPMFVATRDGSKPAIPRLSA